MRTDDVIRNSERSEGDGSIYRVSGLVQLLSMLTSIIRVVGSIAPVMELTRFGGG